MRAQRSQAGLTGRSGCGWRRHARGISSHPRCVSAQTTTHRDHVPVGKERPVTIAVCRLARRAYADYAVFCERRRVRGAHHQECRRKLPAFRSSSAISSGCMKAYLSGMSRQTILLPTILPERIRSLRIFANWASASVSGPRCTRGGSAPGRFTTTSATSCDGTWPAVRRCVQQRKRRAANDNSYANRKSHNTSSTCCVERSTCPARCAIPSRRHNAGRSGRMAMRSSGMGVVASWGNSAAP